LGRGVVYAIKAGFAAVGSGPALVVMADLSDDLAIVPRMLDLYAQGNRIVCASRYVRGGKQLGGPWLKRTMSRAAGLSLRSFACLEVPLSTFDLVKRFLTRSQPSQIFRTRPSLEELEQRLVLTVPAPDHVVIVMEANHGFGDIIGNTANAPYINNTLLPTAA